MPSHISPSASRQASARKPKKPALTRRASVYLAPMPVFCGNSLDFYPSWPSPHVIVSDGAYGVSGFKGDTATPQGVLEWYRPHILAWSAQARPNCTLWFWNTEIGWAMTHPLLESQGWQYQSCNIWDKGLAHIAGNVNTKTVVGFPVVTEVCVQYTKAPTVNGLGLQDWFLGEWRRSGLALKKANEAVGVKNAASRKYLTADHLWYPPPVEAFLALKSYANLHGRLEGRPYFDVSEDVYAVLRKPVFHLDCGLTNVWSRPGLRDAERLRINGKALHPNQKPLDLMTRCIASSSNEGDIVWEPFGGTFSASLAAKTLGRDFYAAELNPEFFKAGCERLAG